jgi:hypothetical protein
LTDEVKFTAEQWETVARAAEVFARALDDERGRLRDVLTKNWAGDCGEGVGTIENLRLLLNGASSESLAGAISSEVVYLLQIANKSRMAKESLTAQDLAHGSKFRSAT